MKEESIGIDNYIKNIALNIHVKVLNFMNFYDKNMKSWSVCRHKKNSSDIIVLNCVKYPLLNNLSIILHLFLKICV